jgi:CRISPR-associated protein Csb2
MLAALAPPPVLYLPPATTAHTRHYDVANQSVKFFDTFVALHPTAAVVWMWPETFLTPEDDTALTALLAALGTFGRAESWCEITLLTPDALPVPNSAPLEDGQSLTGLDPVRVLLPGAPAADLLEILRIETSTMRQQRHLDPPGSRWVTYTRPAAALTAHRVAPPRRRTTTPHCTVARYALDAAVLPLVQDTLPFAEHIRRALIRLRTRAASHSTALLGKTAAGTPLADHQHAHYFMTDEDDDGRLDHLTVYAPCGLDHDDVHALSQITRIFQRDNRPEVHMVLTGLGQPTQFRELPLFARGQRWQSVTPFSLPRFASRGSGKAPRPRDLPEAQARRELRVRQLPEPSTLAFHRGYDIPGRPLVRWLDFHARRFNGEQGYGLAGFTLEFADAVQGPLALGFACHFGLGLFLPT